MSKSVDQLIKENSNLFRAISILLYALKEKNECYVLHDWDIYRKLDAIIYSKGENNA